MACEWTGAVRSRLREHAVSLVNKQYVKTLDQEGDG